MTKEKFTKEQEPYIIISCEETTVGYIHVLEVHTADNRRYWLPTMMVEDIFDAMKGNYKKSENIILEARALRVLYMNKLINKEL